jgi:hypothetical protein
MHPLYEKADRLSSEVIGAAIEVHRDKGPGLIEVFVFLVIFCLKSFRTTDYADSARIAVSRTLSELRPVSPFQPSNASTSRNFCAETT